MKEVTTPEDVRSLSDEATEAERTPRDTLPSTPDPRRLLDALIEDLEAVRPRVKEEEGEEVSHARCLWERLTEIRKAMDVVAILHGDPFAEPPEGITALSPLQRQIVAAMVLGARDHGSNRTDTFKEALGNLVDCGIVVSTAQPRPLYDLCPGCSQPSAMDAVEVLSKSAADEIFRAMMDMGEPTGRYSAGDISKAMGISEQERSDRNTGAMCGTCVSLLIPVSEGYPCDGCGSEGDEPGFDS